MPIPTSIDDLSTVASSNSPAGGDNPKEGDDNIRALASFIALLRNKLNGTSATGTLTTPTFSGAPAGTVVGSTYTPTLTNHTNISASTAWQSQYQRVGSTATFSGYATGVQPGGAGGCVLRVSLPIASNFAGGGYLAVGAGSAYNAAGSAIAPVQIVANSANSINVTFFATGTDTLLVGWHCTYTIV